MSDARERASGALQRLVEVDGVHGACIVSRDGLPVISQWPHTANVDTVAAMGAALMGAAETSLMEFGDRTFEEVSVVSNVLRITILGLDDEVLLLAAMDRNVPAETVNQTMKAYMEELGAILSEA